MNDLYKIVNLQDHPLQDLDSYANDCNLQLTKNSILQLDNFLNKNALSLLQEEAESLHSKAFYCQQNHTIFLNKIDTSKHSKVYDPCNIEVKSDKGCVPHDLIPSTSLLNFLYQSIDFINFIKKVLGVNKIFPYKDKLSSINYNFYEKNQQLGWHFDNASFAITLMIKSPDKGGNFEYINEGRNFEKKTINNELIGNVLKGKIKGHKLNVLPGTLILFYGRNYLHRVTPVESIKERVLVTLNYNTERNIELSKNARKTFFGRIN